ncbi:hypothetical protein EK904_012332 [Melospiza melodia maxima]|nr:hypothetical protein EK904_012332 [Melospiza melodia maxima]
MKCLLPCSVPSNTPAAGNAAQLSQLCLGIEIQESSTSFALRNSVISKPSLIQQFLREIKQSCRFLKTK